MGKADNLGRLAVLAALVVATTVPVGPVNTCRIPGPAPTRVTAAAEVPPVASESEKLRAARTLGIVPTDAMMLLRDKEFVIALWRQATGSEVRASAELAFAGTDLACTEWIKSGILAANERDQQQQMRDAEAARVAREAKEAALIVLGVAPEAELLIQNDRDFLVTLLGRVGGPRVRAAIISHPQRVRGRTAGAHHRRPPHRARRGPAGRHRRRPAGHRGREAAQGRGSSSRTRGVRGAGDPDAGHREPARRRRPPGHRRWRAAGQRDRKSRRHGVAQPRPRGLEAIHRHRRLRGQLAGRRRRAGAEGRSRPGAGRRHPAQGRRRRHPAAAGAGGRAGARRWGRRRPRVPRPGAVRHADAVLQPQRHQRQHRRAVPARDHRRCGRQARRRGTRCGRRARRDLAGRRRAGR